jgi:hypothetical protein
MHSTSCRAVAFALLAACAPVGVKPLASSQPSSAPSSQPVGKTFNPVNPKDPTQGYFVPYDAAQALLTREYKRDQAAGLAKIDCDERVQLTIDSQPVSAWNLWVKPTVVGVALFLVGVGTGVVVEAVKK